MVNNVKQGKGEKEKKRKKKVGPEIKKKGEGNPEIGLCKVKIKGKEVL